MDQFRNQLQPIYNSSLRVVFEDYVASLKIPLIDYFAVGVQNTIHRGSASIMSRIEWQKRFASEGFAQHDPIRIAALDSKKDVFLFDEVDYLSSFGNEIMDQRKKYEIRNGLVIMDRRGSHNFQLTLGTGYHNFKGKDFFLKYRTDLFRIFKDFIAIIEPVSKVYISGAPNSLKF